MVQVYPTLVIRGTGLYELWKKGLYRNYEPTQLIDLVARILALVPPWVRIYRIQVPVTTPLLPVAVRAVRIMAATAVYFKQAGLQDRKYYSLL